MLVFLAAFLTVLIIRRVCTHVRIALNVGRQSVENETQSDLVATLLLTSILSRQCWCGVFFSAESHCFEGEMPRQDGAEKK